MINQVPIAAIRLCPSMFSDAERVLLKTNVGVVSGFRYSSGVEAVHIVTDRVDVIILPFRGQQVWRYVVDGEDLTMRTHFDEPNRSTVFSETYGGFLLHCGLTGIGAPSPSDTHAHHGELPNGHYDEVELVVGTDPDGDWLGIRGTFRLRVTHGIDASFEPALAIKNGSTALHLDMRITNHRLSKFDYSYLCHINFPIFDHSTLVQTVHMDEDHFELAPHANQDAPTAEYMARIADNFESSNQLDVSTPVVPEYCAILKPYADDAGWAHFMQIRHDGTAAAVSYETRHLPYAVRWISNTGDELAAGFCLPSTAHHRGRAAAERDGMVRSIPGKDSIEMRVVVEVLSAAEASHLRSRIEAADVSAPGTGEHHP